MIVDNCGLILSRVLICNLFKKNLFSTTVTVFGRKSRDPYDRRWGIHPKDAGAHKPGGSRELASKLGKTDDMPQPPGYFDKRGRFHYVAEMVPEFIVPDLDGFELKPYVSYRAPSVKQSEFSAKDLFDATYGKEIHKLHKSGKLNEQTVAETMKTMKSGTN